jgi:hypothetical protein
MMLANDMGAPVGGMTLGGATGWIALWADAR